MRVGKQHLVILPFLLLGLLGFVLPTVKGTALASPDETTAYVTIRRFGDLRPAILAEPLAVEFPWLHPRSWKSHDLFIVPVGFLGWPWTLSFSSFINAKLPIFLASILILSSVLPLYQLLLRFGKKGAFWGSIIYLTFPPVLLYVNRSLFANGAVLAGALWSVFLLDRLKQRTESTKKIHGWLFLTGLIIALTAAARPVEMIWVLPWLIWAGWGIGFNKKKVAWFVGGMLPVLLPLCFQALVTYGNPFLSGYWLSENRMPLVNSTIGYTEFTPPVAQTDISDLFLPYGFHPRNILWNIRSFFFGFLLLWMIPLALSPYVRFRRGLRMKPPKTIKELFQPTWLAVWSGVVLLVLYGSGLYADNVRVGAVTIGNSFLRYLLPVSVLVSIAIAYLFKRSDTRLKTAAVTALCLLLALFGVYKAMAGDDESLLMTRPELERYAEVREATHEWFGPQDVIISERSDKIFFPEFRAVSPIPSEEEVGRLVNTKDVQVGLYVRPLSQKEKDAWKEYGVEPIELADFARERLYILKPTQR